MKNRTYTLIIYRPSGALSRVMTGQSLNVGVALGSIAVLLGGTFDLKEEF